MPSFDRIHAVEKRTEDLLKINTEVTLQLRQALELLKILQLAQSANNAMFENFIEKIASLEKRIESLERARLRPWDMPS